MLTWRETEEADLDVCLCTQPHAIGDRVVGYRRAIEIWKSLRRSGALISRVVHGRAGNRTICVLGSSVFVRPAFLESEIRHPRPGVNARILASIDEGHPVVLTHDEIALANASGSLDAVCLSAVAWPTSTPAELAEMMMASVGSCADAHAGYHLRSIIAETPTDLMDRLAPHAGEIEILQRFADTDLWRLTRERVHAAASSLSNLLFSYRRPRFLLRRADQHLLTAALGGAIDRELADKLGLTTSAVKKRWQSIYDTIENAQPEFFSGVSGGRDGTRGPQKRHRVLSYVRDHIEEIRPYGRPARGYRAPD
jgi:hypothetical protein